jgi:peptide/nickel transport system ATP-binding protein
MTQVLLDVKNLSVEFSIDGDIIKAVNDVSFSLNKGETIGIVGESGSGKSVASLALMRLIPNPPGKIAGGEILFYDKNDSVDLCRISEKEMQKYRGNKIAMIFQEPMTSLNPVFSCGDQVMEAIMLHQKSKKKDAKAETIDLFRQVLLPGPESIFDSYPHQLSGGQKQRVMIAMAMSCRPSILIADEPTTALDVTVQKTILELMQELQLKHKMGIIFITHDLGVIAELADRVLVMHKGKIVEQGNVLNIFSDPKHPYTKGLLACRPSLEKRLKKLPTVSDFMEIASNGEIIEKQSSISVVTNQYVVTEDERKNNHQKLYSQEPVLKVKNLKTYFTKKNFLGKIKEQNLAVDDVSFEVYPGETLGLVGESGCGKTTLGRTILRLVEASEGELYYKGQNLLLLEKEQLRALRKKIQIIFQDPYSSLNPRMTIGEAITEPMKVHKLFNNETIRKERALDLLGRVNMDESHYYRYPHEFSGGQRQRICIARALAVNPEFIVCDESVSALDVSVQAQVLNLLNKLKRDFGFTYIFISHDLSVVKFMCDRMIVMNKGKIEEIGDADEIYANPQSPYTQQLISAIPKGRLNDIKKAMENRKNIRLNEHN